MSWNGPNSTSNSPGKRPAADASVGTKHEARITKHGLLAGLIVVVLGGAALWFFTRQSPSPQPRGTRHEARNTAPIAETTPAAVTNNVAETKKVPPKPRFLPDGTPVPPDGRPTRLGRRKIHGVVTNYSNVAHAQVAENGVEQVLLQVFSRQRGDMPMPLPFKFSAKNQKEMAEILLREHVIATDDSDSVRGQKEILNMAKKELRDYIRQGGTVEQFLDYYQNELETGYRVRKDAMKMAFDSYRNDDPETTKELCDALNKKLEEKGIKPISLPKAKQ